MASPRTVKKALDEARHTLGATATSTPALDAQVLLAHIIDRPRSWVLAHPEKELRRGQQRALSAALARLETGAPLPHVIGEWEFYGLNFDLTADVLIPRPETELLVDTALDWLQRNPGARLIADVGSGSGCIAVSVAAHAPSVVLIASDVALSPLKIARTNAIRHSVADRIRFIQADLLPVIDRPIDLVCANLPYIPNETLHTLDVYGREPTLALDGGPGGLALIDKLLTQIRGALSRSGAILLEIDAAHGPEAMALAESYFSNARAEILADLAGHDRLLSIQT